MTRFRFRSYFPNVPAVTYSLSSHEEVIVATWQAFRQLARKLRTRYLHENKYTYNELRENQPTPINCQIIVNIDVADTGASPRKARKSDVQNEGITHDVDENKGPAWTGIGITQHV